ncbi:MAG: family 1 glycosylhydrolase [Candidatus Limnocylindrales bacterium]
MTDLVFPPDFLWGAATAAHQVEGDNVNSDWWDWERQPGSPCVEPSGKACEHYTRYPADIALLASLGLNTYRFSVEWARVEPADGTFDPKELAHYRAVVDCVRSNGLTPMVTLNHFTMPRWVAAEGGWTSKRTPALFERYCRRVLEALGDGVPWYCTINEPTALASGAYVSKWGLPPKIVDLRKWRMAEANLVDGHKRAVSTIHELRPGAKAGLAAFSVQRVANAGAKPATEFNLRAEEDVFLEAAADDDFIGVQTYTRRQIYRPRIVAPLTRLALAARPFEKAVVPRVLALTTAAPGTQAPAGSRVTQMGWEFRPEALAEAVRRIARMYPEKDLVVTEHGIATLDDRERVEFIARGLTALHQAMAEGLRVRGYVHWSLMDNFEWAHGYRPKFGLIGVDRETQERTVKPSARFLGEIAKTGRLTAAT